MTNDHENWDREYTDDELWGEKGKPVMREPDFSDVRKKIFNPWKIILFAILAAAFWWIYFFYIG